MESQFWRASRACPPSCCDDDHLARSDNLLHCSNHAKAKVSEADELLQSSSPNTAPRKSRKIEKVKKCPGPRSRGKNSGLPQQGRSSSKSRRQRARPRSA
jgi:hypothetical protein